MFGVIMLFPLILLLLITWLMIRAKKRVKFYMNKKSTYIIVAVYIVILLVATVTVEVYETKFSAEMPDPVVEDSHLLDEIYGDGDFDSIDPFLIIDKREHVIGNRLILKKSNFDDMSPVNIFIERKNDNDGVIEETIYKPLLFNDGLDFSDRVKYALPKWDDDTVFFPRQPETIINYSSYRDAFLISQFTKKPVVDFQGHGGMSQQITIHLLVPKNIEIDASEELYITYVEK
ncbi:hypothetical protein [Sporosarcina sp. G11-34]|uniref:hypothetical protein n=1 Tax=Sporosarcina sp. G11-34 TaxID=2849605 RepID=UPI0022A8DB0C|nr:hypothetical protein [Sporosarcina sp. G11-34]MCZ2257441.1 hypothetical protein [Sporosarcina sp. G11-34]